jgi:hypothetical protein
VDYDRKISGRGTLIIVYDPSAAENTPPYQKRKDATKYTEIPVPAGYEVKVIDARIKMTRLAAA